MEDFAYITLKKLTSNTVNTDGFCIVQGGALANILIIVLILLLVFILSPLIQEESLLIPLLNIILGSFISCNLFLIIFTLTPYTYPIRIFGTSYGGKASDGLDIYRLITHKPKAADLRCSDSQDGVIK